jgi:hypothetical protein
MKNPYFLPQKEKESQLLNELNRLTHHHQQQCPEYARLLDLFYGGRLDYSSLAELPYLPVNLFKTHDLLSIPRDQIFKILKSSGTTSSHPSKIFLDAATAQRQTHALAEIITSYLGETRLPMLVVDTPNLIKDRQSYSARGAALVGMMTFGRDFFYALDDSMALDRAGVERWLQQHQGRPILIFGMTYMVWEYFLQQIEPLAIPQGIVMHTGGWKKMHEKAVDNAAFKEELLRKTKISRCHNFYGMVEQVGSVFVECEVGYLHCPEFADLIVRNPNDWRESEQEGVIQVLSTLPTSYPGHSLLTEDLGIISKVDNCPCGRKGKAFQVLGRVPQAEIRGCSDTYAMAGDSR